MCLCTLGRVGQGRTLARTGEIPKWLIESLRSNIPEYPLGYGRGVGVYNGYKMTLYASGNF